MIILDLQLAESAVEEYVINLLTKQRENKQMPRYDSNPAEVVAGFAVYPKARYTVEVGEPKPSKYTAKDELKAGIRYNLRIVDGEFKGKSMSYFGDELNDFGKAANKRLIMAAHGLEISDENEKKFNTEISPTLDWYFNTDDNSLGSGWLSAKGKVIDVEVDINTDKEGTGKQFQKFVSFHPYPPKAAAA